MPNQKKPEVPHQSYFFMALQRLSAEDIRFLFSVELGKLQGGDVGQSLVLWTFGKLKTTLDTSICFIHLHTTFQKSWGTHCPKHNVMHAQPAAEQGNWWSGRLSSWSSSKWRKQSWLEGNHVRPSLAVLLKTNSITMLLTSISKKEDWVRKSVLWFQRKIKYP